MERRRREGGREGEVDKSDEEKGWREEMEDGRIRSCIAHTNWGSVFSRIVSAHGTNLRLDSPPDCIIL